MRVLLSYVQGCLVVYIHFRLECMYPVLGSTTIRRGTIDRRQITARTTDLGTDTLDTVFVSTMVTPIHKGKETFLMSNYRPITLLPAISKICEHFIHNRLFNFLETLNILSEFQYSRYIRRYLTPHFQAVPLATNLAGINILTKLHKIFRKLNHALNYIKHFLSRKHLVLIYNSCTTPSLLWSLLKARYLGRCGE